MAEDPVAAGGTGGEPAEPVATSSPTGDAELLSTLEPGKGETPDPNAEIWERFRKGDLDLTKAPEDVRAMAEKPFLSLSSKKIEEANQREQRMFSILEKIAAEKGAPQGEPPVDKRALLREKYEQGDIDAVVDIVKSEVYQEVAPQLDGLAMRNAIEAAGTWRPEINDPVVQQDVAAVFNQNPILVKYAAINKREIAPYLLAGATAQVLIPKLMERNKQLEAEKAQIGRDAVEAYKAQLKGLPTSTSMAGRTPTGFTAPKPMTLEEAAEAAWREQKGA